MLILGIESSCDETGTALIDSEKGLLAHRIHTQIDMHRAYGGVVPELASRDHIRRVLALTDEVLEEAGKTRSDLGAIAVTEGPGLAGALLVGISVAHAIGYALGIPVIGVHHLEGHLLASLLADPAPRFPFVALLVSGGHTQFMRVQKFGSYELLGETLDDAAGEAFDKTAQLLGMCYPGGPGVSALAEKGVSGAIELPRPMMHSPDLNMSFSGLKTAVLNAVTKAPNPEDPQFRANVARAFVDAVTDVLAAKAVRALKKTRLNSLVVAGGVSANKQLRARLTQEVEKRHGKIFFPPLSLCTDNGAMIAIAGLKRLQAMTPEELDACRKRWSFSAKPRWTLTEAAHPDQTACLAVTRKKKGRQRAFPFLSLLLKDYSSFGFATSTGVAPSTSTRTLPAISATTPRRPPLI